MSLRHEYHNAHLLNLCPDSVNSDDWQLFIDEMQSAECQQQAEHPVQIDLELNSGCNMACPFCRHGYEDIENKNVDIERIKRLIDEAVAFGVKSIKFSYINEPLINKQLEHVVDYAKQQGIVNLYFTTNGTLLTPERRAKLLASHITKIFVSIDAATAVTYDKQRLSGQFDRVVTNVIALIKERGSKKFPIVRVSFLRNRLNLHEMQQFKTFWQNKADVIAFQKMNEVPDQNTGILPDENNDDLKCAFPFKQLVVDADGDILPCCTLYGKKLKLGNIQSMTLKQAWQSESMQKLQHIHKTNQWKNNPVCKRCILG